MQAPKRPPVTMVYLRPRADADSKMEAAVTFEDGTTVYVPLTRGARAEMLKQIAAAFSAENAL